MSNTICDNVAVPPALPYDCKLYNVTFDSVRVNCKPGFDGGLPQTFVLEVRLASGDHHQQQQQQQQHHHLRDVVPFNETSARPEFLIKGLLSSSHYFFDLYSFNAKGRSKDTVFLEVHTARQPPQPQLHSASADNRDDGVKYSFSAGSWSFPFKRTVQ